MIDQNEFILLFRIVKGLRSASSVIISSKHAPYVTRVRGWDIKHAACVIGTYVRTSQYILYTI